jgi:hypothetical protein
MGEKANRNDRFGGHFLMLPRFLLFLDTIIITKKQCQCGLLSKEANNNLSENAQLTC